MNLEERIRAVSPGLPRASGGAFSPFANFMKEDRVTSPANFRPEDFAADLQRYEKLLAEQRAAGLSEDSFFIRRSLRRIETVKRTIAYFEED